MRVVITGAAGMIGQRLASRLVEMGEIDGMRITALELHDVVDRAVPRANGIEVVSYTNDVSSAEVAASLASRLPAIVFHLASVVSGEAEADLHKGYRVNLDGTRALFDALRDMPHSPRLIFASSLAVFGAPFPDGPIPDDFHLTPLTSYGTQKMIGEALLADYSRRGLVDGVGIRLPTVTVRPGQPNAAVSGFFSSIIREPLAGREARLPVEPSVRHPHASPRSAVGFLVHAATMDTRPLGDRRNLTMPGVSVTVGEQLAALERVAGTRVADLVRHAPDPNVAAIVAGWPQAFSAERARALGFECEKTFDDIIHAYIDDSALP